MAWCWEQAPNFVQVVQATQASAEVVSKLESSIFLQCVKLVSDPIGATPTRQQGLKVFGLNRLAGLQFLILPHTRHHTYVCTTSSTYITEQLTSTCHFWRFPDSSVVPLKARTHRHPTPCTVAVGRTRKAGVIQS